MEGTLDYVWIVYDLGNPTCDERIEMIYASELLARDHANEFIKESYGHERVIEFKHNKWYVDDGVWGISPLVEIVKYEVGNKY
jgi:hypothetical protein